MPRLAVPLVFVLIWSTGFIVAKAVLPHADLQLFLVARFSLTAIVMGCAALIVGAPWPGARRAAPHVVAGAVMQGIYLCASYWAITHGMAAGVMALLGALQPLFTALFAVSRTVGWVSQWKEMMEDPQQRIGRPRQVYTGAPQRDYVPVSKRA